MITEYTKRIEFYSKLIQPKELVFDIGANVGNRTSVFLEIGAEVIAFEPQKRCFDYLTKKFGNHSLFYGEHCAIGSTKGIQEMMVCEADTLSSLSKEWIEATKKSGRFEAYHWNQLEQVRIETLNDIITKHGVPKFIKIDVEGYEFEVLSTLNQPIEFLSIEFTPEHMSNTIMCLDYLVALSQRAQFNFSVGESMAFEFSNWVNEKDIKQFLSKFDSNNFGDVYIRMT